MIVTRRSFKIEDPIREIIQSDTDKKFQSGLFQACGTTLKSLYTYDNEDNRHVWVYDANDEIFAALIFDDLDDVFYIEAVSNNFDVSTDDLESTKPGGTLYSVLENIAIDLKIKKITLDSIERRVGYWIRLDFQINGTPYDG